MAREASCSARADRGGDRRSQARENEAGELVVSASAVGLAPSCSPTSIEEPETRRRTSLCFCTAGRPDGVLSTAQFESAAEDLNSFETIAGFSPNRPGLPVDIVAQGLVVTRECDGEEMRLIRPIKTRSKGWDPPPTDRLSVRYISVNELWRDLVIMMVHRGTSVNRQRSCGGRSAIF